MQVLPKVPSHPPLHPIHRGRPNPSPPLSPRPVGAVDTSLVSHRPQKPCHYIAHQVPPSRACSSQASEGKRPAVTQSLEMISETSVHGNLE